MVQLRTALIGLIFACSPSKPEVVVYTSVDQVFSEPVFRACEAKAGLKVRAVFDTEETKSTGVLNRLISESSNPQADVFWSGDPVRPFTLIDRGLVQPYRPPTAKDLPAHLRDKRGNWTGFAARARVLLVNNDRVPANSTPTSIHDLVNSRYRGQVAIANPLFGTTTMHIAALHTRWGEAATKQFLKDLRKNEVRVASSNGEVKRLVVSGEVAFGLTDTDDAHEAVASGANVRVVYPDQTGIGTLVMPTSVVQMRGGPNAQSAHKLIDCLTSAEVELLLAKNGAHMPLRKATTKLPPDVIDVQSIKAMELDYGEVAKTMVTIEPLLREWVGL